jgi:hypothetical protein
LAVDRVELTPDGRFVVVPRDATNASTIEARPTDKKDEWDVDGRDPPPASLRQRIHR